MLDRLLALVLTIINVLLTVVLHLTARVILQRSEVPGRPSHSQLLVLHLHLLQLLLELLNPHVHHLDLLALLVMEALFEAGTITLVLVSLHELDLLHQLLLLLGHLVDTLNEVDVILHQTTIRLPVLLQVARQLASVVADMHLVSIALTSVGLVLIDLGLLAGALFEHPGFVEADDALLQLLVVLDVLNDLEHVVLEPLLLDVLDVEFVPTAEILVLQALVLHLKVIDNKVKVVTDPRKVLHLYLHLVDLLVQAGNIVLTRQDISLQLLDLVVKDEFELLQLLCLLLQLDDAGILVLNGRSSGLKFGLLSLDLALQLIDGDVEGARLARLLSDLLGQGLTVKHRCSEFAGLLLQVALLVHALLDELVELLAIIVLDLIDLVPGILFNLLTLLLVGLFELLNLLLFLLVLLLLLLFLKLVLLMHLSLGLVLREEQFLDILLEVHLLVLLGFQELLSPLGIIPHLLIILELLKSQLFLMDLFQVLLFFFSSELNLLLLHRQLLCGLLELHLLLFDLVLKIRDLLLILLHRLFELHVACLLLQVDIGLQVLDPLLDGVQVLFLNQNLAMDDVCLLQPRLLLHGEAAKSAVDADGEELRVVEVQAHPLNLLSVRLDLEDFLHCIIAVAEDLDGAGATGLSQASVDHITSLANKDLRVGQVLFVSQRLLATIILCIALDFTDGAITASSVDDRLFGALGLVASNGAVAGLGVKLEAPGRVGLIRFRV